jgi:hypothetical protein
LLSLTSLRNVGKIIAAILLRILFAANRTAATSVEAWNKAAKEH